MATEPLLLRAEEPDDLVLLSALVQDMALRVADIRFLHKEQLLVLLGNRFRWEEAVPGPDKGGRASRIRSALRFAFVTRVRKQRWPTDGDTVLPLLSITFTEEGGLLLNFGGGAALSCTEEVLDATLEDLSGEWEARAVPDHFDD